MFRDLSVLGNIGRRQVESIGGNGHGVRLHSVLQRFVTDSRRFLDRDPIWTLKECDRSFNGDRGRCLSALRKRKVKSPAAVLQRSMPKVADDGFRVTHAVSSVVKMGRACVRPTT